jgi:serine/threonine protein phosphatase PrpC
MGEEVTTCRACGEALRPGDRFCEACGAAVCGADPAVQRPRQPFIRGDRERMELAFDDLAGISDRGLRRPRNEDAVAVESVEQPPARVMVVCDGVSTSAEPALASQAAAEAALAHLVASVKRGHPNSELAMKEAVAAAQKAVCELPYPEPGGDEDEAAEGPPATTLVAALLIEGRATLGWVGDSRAYFVGREEAWQLSHDDTWMEELALADRVPDASPNGNGSEVLRANVLTRWLGRDLQGDPEVSITTFRLPAEGCLLLCSDGLWNYAPTPSLMRELVGGLPAGATPLQMTRALVDFACSAGGADNVTVAVALV